MNKRINPTETQERWLKHFSDQLKSGLTPSEYCKLKHITPQHFYQARYRFKEKHVSSPRPVRSGFQRLQVLPEPTLVRPKPAMILLRAGGTGFEISESAPVSLVAKILQELNRDFL